MHSFIRMIALAAMLLALAPGLRAQTAVDPSGHWEGAIQVPGMELKVEVDLAKNDRGALVGFFSQPAQHLSGLPLANLAVVGTSIAFQIKGSGPGNRAFKGVLSSDGKSIVGEFAQTGYSLPFSLTRTGGARIEPPVRNAAIGKALVGTWNGALNVNGVERHLVLTMSNQADGTGTGHFVNVEEALEIPIAAITQEASGVRLEVKAVGGSYAGALNPDGTELIGTLTQGPAVMPLTFRRASPESGK